MAETFYSEKPKRTVVDPYGRIELDGQTIAWDCRIIFPHQKIYHLIASNREGYPLLQREYYHTNRFEQPDFLPPILLIHDLSSSESVRDQILHAKYQTVMACLTGGPTTPSGSAA